MGFTASDLADWWDNTAEEYWHQQDEFIINAYNLGDAQPVVVFAHWFGNYAGSAPNRGALAIAGGLADVLRLGFDFDLEAPNGIKTGIGLNVLRLLSVAQPGTGYIKKEIRHKGLLALAQVQKITGGPKSPCGYTALNNITSFFKGGKDQYFVDLADIIKIRGMDRGIPAKTLLEHPTIVNLLKEKGIVWRQLSSVKLIPDAIKAARNSELPVRFSFTWIRNGKPENHAVLAIRDLKGNVRIVDYAQSLTSPAHGFGFSSWEAMVNARAGTWGEGLRNAVLRTDAQSIPTEFTSDIVQLVWVSDDVATFALPAAVGMKWVKDGVTSSFDQSAESIARSAIKFFEEKFKDKAPPRPEDLYPAPVRPPETASVMGVHTIEGPGIQKKDWLSSIAGQWYGDLLLWPALWDFNKGPDFVNPNKMYVGQRIKIPFLTEKSVAEIKGYRQRGYNWQGESWK